MAANLRRDDRKKRTRERKEEKFTDNNWKGLIEERKLGSLFVYELDKYLKRHNITLKKRTNVDKIQSVIYHYEKQKDSTSANREESDDERVTSSSDFGDEYENLDETWSQDSEIDDFSDSEATWCILILLLHIFLNFFWSFWYPPNKS